MTISHKWESLQSLILAKPEINEYLVAKEMSILATTSKANCDLAKSIVETRTRNGIPANSKNLDALSSAPPFVALSTYEELAFSDFMYNAIRKLLRQSENMYGYFAEIPLDDDKLTSKLAEITEISAHEVSAQLLNFSETTEWSNFLLESEFTQEWAEWPGDVTLPEGFLGLWPRTITQIPLPFSEAPVLLCDMLERFLFPSSCLIAVLKTEHGTGWVFESPKNYYVLWLEFDE